MALLGVRAGVGLACGQVDCGSLKTIVLQITNSPGSPQASLRKPGSSRDFSLLSGATDTALSQGPHAAGTRGEETGLPKQTFSEVLSKLIPRGLDPGWRGSQPRALPTRPSQRGSCCP